MFAKQIGHLMKVYVNDIFTKNPKAKDHIENLRKTFEILRQYKIKFNLAISTFVF